MELSSSNIKKILIFSQKKAFLIFWKMELSDSKVKKRLIFLETKPCTSQPKPKKKKKKIHPNKISLLQETEISKRKL